ncbi:MAG: winged helix-turn-helix transcriptional regulator [Halobacteriales archaeon]|nr:winged helix-turn-helix transcriptional regulator [Halobacteriales archaeon]
MRAAVLVLVSLALAPAALALPVDVHSESDGPPQIGWDDNGSLLPGDDVVTTAQGVRTVDVDFRAPYLEDLAPALAVEADLRDLRVDEPALQLVRAADGQLDAIPLPAGFTVTHDQLILDIDVTNPANDHGGDFHDAMDLPNPETWGPPVTVTDDGAAVEPTLTSNSDRFTERVDESMTQMCKGFGADLRYAVAQVDPVTARGGMRCPEQTIAPWVEPLLPTWMGRYELQDVRIALDGAVGFAADSLAAPGHGVPPAWPGVGGRALPAGLADLGAPEALASAALGWDGSPASPGVPGAGFAPTGSDASFLPVQGPELLAAALAGLGLALLAIPLYRRLVQRDVSEHPVRARLVEVVSATPGIHEMQAAKQLGISHTLAQYHVRMLVEFGALEVKRFGGRKCLFVPGRVGRAEKSILLAERAGKGGQLLDLVTEQPGIGQRDIARQLGIRESSVKWHLDRLAEQGLVVIAKDAAGKRVRLSDETARLRVPVPLTLVPAQAAPAGPVEPLVAAQPAEA